MVGKEDDTRRRGAEEERDEERVEALPASLSAALTESSSEALQALDDDQEWEGFGAAVWARIDETDEDHLGASEAWPRVAAALREDHAAALGAFEAQLSEFNDGFALRWVEDRDRDAETLGDVLRAEVETAVDAKTGVWSAFAHQVMLAIDQAEGRSGEVTDRAIAALRAEVDSELDAMAPRFDRDFREGVERKIFRSARTPLPWWSRIADAVGAWFRPNPALGFAAAAAAVALFAVLPGPPREVIEPAGGRVSISAVRFGGTVTVMPDDGIAVVWVTDSAS